MRVCGGCARQGTVRVRVSAEGARSLAGVRSLFAIGRSTPDALLLPHTPASRRSPLLPRRRAGRRQFELACATHSPFRCAGGVEPGSQSGRVAAMTATLRRAACVCVRCACGGCEGGWEMSVAAAHARPAGQCALGARRSLQKLTGRAARRPALECESIMAACVLLCLKEGREGRLGN